MVVGVVVAVLVAVYWAATLAWVWRQPHDWRWPGEGRIGGMSGMGWRITLTRTQVSIVAVVGIVAALAVAVFQVVVLDLW